jgi:ABC-2 type transport system permease protein
LVPLFATMFVWRTISETQGDVGTYSYSEMVFYFVAVLIVETFASPTEDEWRIAAEIRDGQISAILIKPINHLLYRLSLFFSYRLIYSLITLPVIAAVLWFARDQLRWPVHPESWLLFGLATVGSALIQFFIAYSLAMLAFWILEVSTVIFLLYSFEYFLSGHVFPLDLLSPTVLSALKWTPFPYELFFPVEILLERIHGRELLHGFVAQFFWVLITGWTARTLWKRGVQVYQAAGG